MIQLKNLDDSFIPFLINWKKDEELAYLIMAKTSENSETDIRNWIDKNQSDPNQRIWGIYSNDLNKPIGIGRLMFIDWESGVTELGVYIGENDAKGKGYGKQSVRLLLENAFIRLKLRKVFLKVLSTNIEAINLYKKLNFKVEGILKNHYLVKKNLHDIIYMSIFEDEFRIQ